MKIKSSYRFSTQKTLSTYEKQGGRCIYCYGKFEFCPNHPKSPTWEHIQPISKGGKDDPDNVVLACKKCNLKRGNIPIERFLDGYIAWTITGRMQGDDSLQSITVEKKVRGPRRWYHKFIGYSI